MSVSGKLAMAALRLIQPGKGSFSDLKECRARAERENARFVFSLPRSSKVDFSLLEGTGKPCPILRPKKPKDAEKAVLYIYGGVTNNWKTQRSMAIDFAAASGVETWYPVYPACTEVPMRETLAYLVEIYRRMTERFEPKKIVLCGVSMGGYYALQIVNWINHYGLDLPMPGLVIAHSPGGTPDNEADWDEMRKYEKRDPMFSEADLRMTLRLIPGDETPGWLLTPANGDFRNAPPTYLYFGEEMLAGNAVTYRRAYEQSGSGDRLHVEIVQNMMHGYSCMPVFPESKRAYYETLKLIEKI
ncbi:MAG: alpha/beta hydrolase [Oscillospiraceae bacterium]|nr:alpha/beta hydrolase [Oscillospiraceae bacterium]